MSMMGCTSSTFNYHGRIARVLQGVYHTESGEDDSDIYDSAGWIDLGPVNKTEKIIIYARKMSEARENPLYVDGAEILESMIPDLCDVIILKLYDVKTASLTPLKIQLEPNGIPVRAKQRRHPV